MNAPPPDVRPVPRPDLRHDLGDDLPNRISCADSTFPKLSHDIALAVIADLGITAVDVCVFEGYEHTPPAAVVEDPGKAADAVIERLERHHLRAVDVFAILGNPLELNALAVNHPDETMREEALRRFHPIVEFATRIGAPGITLLPGSVFEGMTVDACIDLAAAELQRRAEIAGEAGLGLSIEAHYESVVETPARTLDLLEKAPDVTITLDYGHFIYQGISQDDVDVLLPRTRHVQLRQAAPGDMQTPARAGTIDFGVMLDRLADRGYVGHLGLEYQWDEWMEFNRVDCTSETAELRDVLLEWAAAQAA